MLGGTGNLNFGGWGGICEVIEHLHTRFVADAIADIADFFERLSGNTRVRHRAAKQCNAIAAVLDANHNVEACILRIQWERSTGWSYVQAEPRDPPVDPLTELEVGEMDVGVLRAILEANQLIGQVLTPRISGTVYVFHLENTVPKRLGTTQLTPDSVY